MNACSRNVEAEIVPARIKARFSRISVSLLLACFSIGGTARAQVSRETVLVPMRDGVRLATDLYRSASPGKKPVLLMRTPYNKDRGRQAAEFFAAAGYVAAVQDCRGKFASEGNFNPYSDEGPDRKSTRLNSSHRT